LIGVLVALPATLVILDGAVEGGGHEQRAGVRRRRLREVLVRS